MQRKKGITAFRFGMLHGFANRSLKPRRGGRGVDEERGCLHRPLYGFANRSLKPRRGGRGEDEERGCLHRPLLGNACRFDCTYVLAFLLVVSMLLLAACGSGSSSSSSSSSSTSSASVSSATPTQNANHVSLAKLVDDPKTKITSGTNFEVTGQVQNLDKSQHDIYLQATLKNASGKVVGIARGLADNVAAGNMDTYTLQGTLMQPAWSTVVVVITKVSENVNGQGSD